MDKWDGDFFSGEKVTGVYGAGVVATRDYCKGIGPEFEGKIVRGEGIRPGLVPVIFEKIGCFWQAPWQLKRIAA
jgi:hypothetical protein